MKNSNPKYLLEVINGLKEKLSTAKTDIKYYRKREVNLMNIKETYKKRFGKVLKNIDTKMGRPAMQMATKGTGLSWSINLGVTDEYCVTLKKKAVK